ncbi:hypothetical protein FA15DRAFT_754149 [Coprinopsis marcescibilis]|uniref:Uncharacterized protein n=1 Tax=Coprinopsis marcescibilis TaxID=230819 RepID=A0A5C3L5Z4_COPMA|nr:hypothetical protein FA15DRAFT_754149 [Coprinopsis marcescibilis]
MPSTPLFSNKTKTSVVIATSVFLLCWAAAPVKGHVGVWAPGMYCGKGNQEGVDDNNSNTISQPMHNLTRSDWWFHHHDSCDQFPPPVGEFLEIPSGGELTVELAVNRAFTTRSAHPELGEFTNGKNQMGPDGISDEGCIWEPNIHTKSELEAAGTAFAISYVDSLSRVTPENLVVFSVLYHTPWRRLATYSVPKLPKCPTGGCICAWGWVPNGCGTDDFYMQGFRCQVTDPVKSAKVMVAKAKPPVWCEDDLTKCAKGSKQLLYWGQQDGNNVAVEGQDLDGNAKRPGYNFKMGFAPGAQNDIFVGSVL